MSKLAKRGPSAGDGGTVEQRLPRLLDEPNLARIVPQLPPETLHQLIRQRGLDACAALITAATPAQLTSLVDLDLWQAPRPGHDEAFDVDRFGEWLEALVDASESIAAKTVAILDTGVVVAGLSRYVRVFDPGIFEPTAQSDDERIDRYDAMREGDLDGRSGVEQHHDRRECEVGGFLVRARRADAWDAIVTMLVALDIDHPDRFTEIMRGCRRLSNSRAEIDGLDDLLATSEQHFHEIAVEREQRRSEQGYATAADARAFLEMARQPNAIGSHSSGRVNPIVAAYFRFANDPPPSTDESATPPPQDRDSSPAQTSAVLQLLAEAGMMPAQPRALLAAGDDGSETTRVPRLRHLMRSLLDSDEAAYLERGRELAFLANTLLAGCSLRSRPFTPPEASDAAAAICNLGIEVSGERQSDAFLVDHDLIAAFEAGWSVLHRDVSMFVAAELIALLRGLNSFDSDIRAGLNVLRRALEKQHAAGAPWRACGQVEILAMLDVAASVCVRGLLEECPIIPAALTATLEGRTTTVSATDFEFISTVAQINDVRAFVHRLPQLL